MIQRKQTIWMMLAAASIFATLKLPTLVTGTEFQMFTGMDNFLIMVLTSALGAAIIINIFLFRNRVLQFRFCITCFLVECGIVALYFWKLSKFASGTFGIWAVFHLIALITLLLAARAIFKDEKLVKDSNRLR